MKILIAIVLVVLATGFVLRKEVMGMFSTIGSNKEKVSKKEESKQNAEAVTIKHRWDLPKELQEISGISYMGNNLVACIQDEDGIVFIYNMATKQIEKEVKFAGPGDYEGIAVVNTSVYVVRSDGRLFFIEDINANKPVVKEYDTPLTQKQDIEGLCYDAKANRLLLAVKGEDPNSKDYKGIYGFNLSTKQLNTTPVYKVTNDDELLAASKRKKKKNSIMPSAIAIHPKGGNVYITDGPKSRLVTLDVNGNLSRVVELGKEFYQPEGITFAPQGEMYISNEGGKGSGNILQVEIK